MVSMLNLIRLTTYRGEGMMRCSAAGSTWCREGVEKGEGTRQESWLGGVWPGAGWLLDDEGLRR